MKFSSEFFLPSKLKSFNKHGLFDSVLSPGHFWDLFTSESPAKFQPAKSTHPILSPLHVTDSSRQLRTREKWACLVIIFSSLHLTPSWQLLRVTGHTFTNGTEYSLPLSQNYTQNIDTLETLAGVQKVLQCHGSFATATCLECRQRVPGTDIEADILSRKVPLCKICNTISSAPIKSKGKKSKKKAKGQWDSDVEDESDGPEYPPSIMKVLCLHLIAPAECWDQRWPWY